jgi:hypothetical protein
VPTHHYSKSFFIRIQLNGTILCIITAKYNISGRIAFAQEIEKIVRCVVKLYADTVTAGPVIGVAVLKVASIVPPRIKNMIPMRIPPESQSINASVILVKIWPSVKKKTGVTLKGK